MQHDIKQKINEPLDKNSTAGEESVKTVKEEEALSAVKTLIRWAGDDPNREGLIDTPGRVTRAYKEFFAGYAKDPITILQKTFPLDEKYAEPVILKRISFSSHCEHHMLPMIGHVDLAYLPKQRVVGLSKLGRIVEVFAQRLQTQEHMTVEIGTAIENGLSPDGVAIHISAVHQCMSLRGLRSADVVTVTRYYGGVYKNDKSARDDIKQALSS